MLYRMKLKRNREGLTYIDVNHINTYRFCLLNLKENAFMHEIIYLYVTARTQIYCNKVLILCSKNNLFHERTIHNYNYLYLTKSSNC